MKKYIFILSAVLLFSACSPVVNSLRTSRRRLKPTNPDYVKIFMSPKAIKQDYDEIGIILAHNRVFIPIMVLIDTLISIPANAIADGEQTHSEVFQDLVRKAAAMGADAVIIKSFVKYGMKLSVVGVAVKLKK